MAFHRDSPESFDEVIGVDVAPSMIDLATRLHADVERCRFVLNETDRLPWCGSGSVDFVYSRLVLQHMHPRYVRRYLAEFMRVLAPVDGDRPPTPGPSKWPGAQMPGIKSLL